MNSILRIYVPSTLNVAAQHIEVLTVTLDLTPNISKQPTHFIIKSIILSGFRVHANISREIYYSIDSLYKNNKSHSGPVQYDLTLKTYQHINILTRSHHFLDQDKSS